MPIQAKSADGEWHIFPDGTDQAVVDRTMKDYAAGKSGVQGERAKGWLAAAKPYVEPIGTTLSNLPGSAGRAALDIVTPIMHPIDTAENLGALGKGVMQKLRILQGTDYEKYPEAVGQFFAQRYGGVDKALHTLETDPVGMLLDASTVLSGGETLLARAPGALGKAGEIAGKTARAIDPLTGLAKTAELAGKAGSKIIGGLTTHVGEETLQEAFEAGHAGGQKKTDVLEHMRREAPVEDVVYDYRRALNQMRSERGQVYKDKIRELGLNKTILNFDDINKAIGKADSVAVYKGQVIDEATAGVRDQIRKLVENWQELDPAEYHTAEGLDALKQQIGNIETEKYTRADVVKNTVYNAIKDTIVKQDKNYAGIMKGYQDASSLLKEMEQTFGRPDKASIDTQLRKLQSILRDNVSSSYGRRRELADFLVRSGASNLMEKLAGQALQSWTPRGLGKTVAGIEGTALASLLWYQPAAFWHYAPVMLTSSPRLMGEAAVALGSLTRNLERIPIPVLVRSLYQAGRLDDLRDLVALAMPAESEGGERGATAQKSPLSQSFQSPFALPAP
jgi:hypothetical protein